MVNGVSNGANVQYVCAVYIDFVLFVGLGCSKYGEKRCCMCVALKAE